MRVLVTGAASVIGRATCLRLARGAKDRGVAAKIAFLLSRDARYVNGHDLVVDGGVRGNFLGRLPGISQITRG